MKKSEVEAMLNKISDSLAPCPLCKGKAEILAMHTTMQEVIIDAVGCRECHLVVEREKRFAKSEKLFAKRPKTVVDPVGIWNQEII